MFRRIAREEAASAIASSRAVEDGIVRRLVQREVVDAFANVSAWGEFREVARTEARREARTEARREARAEVRNTAVAEVERAARAQVPEPVLTAEVRAGIAEIARGAAERAVVQAVPVLVEVSVNGTGLTSVDGDTHAVFPDLLLALGAGCHVFLVGPAGTGKSTLARQAAQALELGFFALSVGPTTPTSKIFGYLDAHGTYHRTPLREAYEHGGLMLLDELDNGHPGLVTELNQALALDVCAFPDGMVRRHERFRLVATGNTYGLGGDRQYVGRQALDAATLDRLVTVEVGIDEQLETRLTLAQAPTRPEDARRVLAEVRRLRRIAGEKRLPVIFSPRASMHAARLLEAGASMSKVLRWCLTSGLSDGHRAALGLGAVDGDR